MNKFLLAAAGFVAAPALAQTAPMIHTPPAGMMATKVQARAEVVARNQRMFAMLDTNHDNVLDQAELAAAGKRWDGAREAGKRYGNRPHAARPQRDVRHDRYRP